MPGSSCIRQPHVHDTDGAPKRPGKRLVDNQAQPTQTEKSRKVELLLCTGNAIPDTLTSPHTGSDKDELASISLRPTTQAAISSFFTNPTKQGGSQADIHRTNAATPLPCVQRDTTQWNINAFFKKKNDTVQSHDMTMGPSSLETHSGSGPDLIALADHHISGRENLEQLEKQDTKPTDPSTTGITAAMQQNQEHCTSDSSLPRHDVDSRVISSKQYEHMIQQGMFEMHRTTDTPKCNLIVLREPSSHVSLNSQASPGTGIDASAIPLTMKHRLTPPPLPPQHKRAKHGTADDTTDHATRQFGMNQNYDVQSKQTTRVGEEDQDTLAALTTNPTPHIERATNGHNNLLHTDAREKPEGSHCPDVTHIQMTD